MLFETDPFYNTKPLNEINVTSLIDVTMVMLIMFIIVAPVIEQGITVRLPATSATAMRPEDAVTISLSADKKIYLGSNPITLPALEDRLKILGAGVPDLPVILRADKSLPYEFVVKVLDIVQRSGILKLGLATKVEIVQQW